MARGRGEHTPQDLKSLSIISTNIKNLLTKSNKKQVDLSRDTGIPPSTLNGYIKGTSLLNGGNLQKIADYFGVPKSSIDPRFSQQSPTNLTPITSKTIQIPVLGSIACGEPILAEENIVEYREVFADNLPSGNLFFLQAKGDSMEPRIPDGSYVLIRQQPDVENGQIAAVLVNGDTEATLKRVRKLGDSVLLEAINEEYAPYLINENNPAKIIGKAVKVEIEL